MVDLSIFPCKKPPSISCPEVRLAITKTTGYLWPIRTIPHAMISPCVRTALSSRRSTEEKSEFRPMFIAPQLTTTKSTCIDYHFLDLMNKNTHKNKQGDWEMSLPFRASNVTMPNNRNQTVKRLNSLLPSFKRRPQLEKDHLDFMAKVLHRGHAVEILFKELLIQREKSTNTNSYGRVW